MFDHLDRIGEAVAQLSARMREGNLQQLETIIEGFEKPPTAINMLARVSRGR